MNRTNEDRYRITVEAFDSFQYYHEEGYLKDYLKESGFTLYKVERKHLPKRTEACQRTRSLLQ